MALDGNNLYVADTENHLIRRVDLKEQTVATIAGTGKQATTVGYQEGAPAPTTALNSPWDLQLVGHSLYIAMAGPHQIWKLDLDSATVGTFAGTGREARLDGPREDAGFAQPSGIASDGKTLYVADSEANVIRAIDLAPGGGVRTLAGGDLFDFGDHDGSGDDVRLQHPLGLIAKADGHLLIADTYNHKLKELDPDTGAVKTLLGTGKPGQRDGSSASFYEPGGLAIANGMLYVADTNNHAIRVVDLKTRRTSTLRIMDLGPPNLASTDTTAETQLPNVQEVRLKPQSLRANSEAQMSIDVKLPDGYHLNPAAPQRYSLRIETGAESLSHAGSQVGKLANLPLQLSVRTLKPGTSVMRITLTIVYCREDNTGTCQIKTLVWRAPVQVVDVPSARTEITIAGSV
jgi:sugar lactone lactonase YvrE